MSSAIAIQAFRHENHFAIDLPWGASAPGGDRRGLSQRCRAAETGPDRQPGGERLGGNHVSPGRQRGMAGQPWAGLSESPIRNKPAAFEQICLRASRSSCQERWIRVAGLQGDKCRKENENQAGALQQNDGPQCAAVARLQRVAYLQQRVLVGLFKHRHEVGRRAHELG